MTKMINYFKPVLLTGLFIGLTTVSVSAQNLGGQKVLNTINRLEQRASNAANLQQNQLQNIIKRADTLITNRINSLNRLSGRLQNDKRLSDSTKSSLSAEIQADISGLNSLKTKIDADTDVATARIDTKQIITNYYIYAKFEPKIRLLIVLGNLQTVSTNVQALVPQLQNLINNFKSQGKEVTQLQSLLDDVSTQLQTINTTLTNDTTKIQNVSISTQDAKATFVQVRQDIAQIVRTDFAKIRADFAQMRSTFRQLLGSVSPSPTSTSTP